MSSTATSSTPFTLDCADQSVTVANALFDSNTATSGGALGMPSHHKNALFKVSASTFIHNTATHGRGGAAYASGYSSGLLFSNGCTFLDNSAAHDGGALSVMDSAGMQATDVVAKRNRAARDGGFLHASFASPSYLQHAALEANAAESGGGGALAVFSSRVALDGVRVRQCAAHGVAGGGALLLEGAEIHLVGRCALENNTATSGPGGHVKMALSTFVAHGRGAKLYWPATKPTFPAESILGEPTVMSTTEVANKMLHGLASRASGGAIFCSASLSSSSATTNEEGINDAGNACVESFPSRSAICFGRGVYLGAGTTVNRSVSDGSGGAIDATLCTIVLENTMFAENTAAAGAGAHGGAVHLGVSSALVAKASTTFIGNAAVGSGASGGAIACDRCQSVTLEDGTLLSSNVATLNGGAVSVVNSVSRLTLSSESLFRGNTAELGDGGAVYCADGNGKGFWNSTGDTFESNIAERGSGGAIAAMGTRVRLAAAAAAAAAAANTSSVLVAACKRNLAPLGGGGCLFWDALATTSSAKASEWLSPDIVNVSLALAIIESNNAAGYGDRIATGPHSLRVSPETEGMRIETAGSGGGTLQPAPKVELLDAYGSIMVGDRAQQVMIETFVVEQGQNCYDNLRRDCSWSRQWDCDV